MWTPRVLVVGAGAGGIAAAVRLIEDGIHDLLVVDREDGVGGVWRANTYPGAGCDVPSHLYSFSFDQNPQWSRRFAGQAEILAYLEDVASRHALAPYLLFRTEVVSCAWDDRAEHWLVTLRGLDDDIEVTREADVVITATGQLSRPADPALTGLDRFAGEVFHSARWDHSVPLAGRRVAVIGTGASAIQFVPPVAAEAAHTSVFQRSAPYIIRRPNRAYSETEKKVYARYPALLTASRARQYLWHEMQGTPFVFAPWLMALPKLAWRRRLQRDVQDPALRARLVPDYQMGCKRVLRAEDWYATITQPSVSVVSSSIASVEAEGVRTEDGVLHPADVIILGTGFATTTFLAPMQVTGQGGRDLQIEWEGGARAYLGTAVPGFPNLFLLYGPGTNLGHSSIIFMIESQLAWVRSAVSALRTLGLKWVAVRPSAESLYDARFRRASRRTVWETGCESWYTVDGRNTNNWPGPTWWFRLRTRKLRLEDVESAPLRVPSAPSPVTTAPSL